MTFKKKYLSLCLAVLIFALAGCQTPAPQESEAAVFDATEYGLCATNDAKSNSDALQALIDRLSEDGGGIVYIPAGEYEFGERARQTIGSHCIKMRSGVSIVGDGEATVLKPVGESLYGLDMFYFNDYLDTKEARYLENCRFEDFVIDAASTSCSVYTSAGKGFMFNLFRNCHWERVTVKNTDATGFGVDCPESSSMIGCTAIGCGKAALLSSSGASGFGIGYGFSDNESMLISSCVAKGNKKFGFFFEHQGRFNGQMYDSAASNDFFVSGCLASENYYGFGGICISGITYDNCASEYSECYGFFFEDSSRAQVIGCSSEFDAMACFAVDQTEGAAFTSEMISFISCKGESSPVALYVGGESQSEPMGDIRMQGCEFSYIGEVVQTVGQITSLTLTDNASSVPCGDFFGQVGSLVNKDNSWN